MKELQQKLDFLLSKYSVAEAAVLNDCETVTVNGCALPLLSHRSERRFCELKNIVQGGTLVGVSVMRTAVICPDGSDIYRVLYREFDLCEYILGKKIKTVTAMENGNVLNVIATAEDGIVCTIEIAATLKAGEAVKDKHEIISQRGIACDVVVDAQLRQASIYIFGEKNQKFTDVDFELYGLDEKEVAIVRAAFALAQNPQTEERRAVGQRLNALINAAHSSVKYGRKEVVDI